WRERNCSSCISCSQWHSSSYRSQKPAACSQREKLTAASRLLIVHEGESEMHLPFIVIVTGPPGTGKTTLAEKIGEVFQLPVFNKDGIKEILFDTLGWSDREWSKRLGHATYMILYHVMERELAARVSFVVE